MFRPARNKNSEVDNDLIIDQGGLDKSGNNLNLSTDEIKGILKDPPGEPVFPMLMFVGAAMKDVVDSADISGIGIVVTTVFSIIFNTFLFIWVRSRGGSGGVSKAMIRKILQRLAATIVVEFIPLLKIIPATTLFVLWVHSQDKALFTFIRGVMGRMKKYKS